MFFLPPVVFLFFSVQLPATVLLGMVAGILAVHLIVVRRGRISLRAHGVIVLIAALEAAVLVPNPAVWPFLLAIWLGSALAGGLADLGIVLWVDSWRPAPRFTTRTRRAAWIVVPWGLVALGCAASAAYKYVFALNPDGVALRDGFVGFLGGLAPVSAIDLLVRSILRKLARRGESSEPAAGPVHAPPSPS